MIPPFSFNTNYTINYKNYILRKHKVEKIGKIWYTLTVGKYHILKKEESVMWVVIVAILIIFAICLAFWRFIWGISKPIFVYLYQRVINALRGTGMTEQAAKAIVSGVVLLIILLILFGCFWANVGILKVVLHEYVKLLF